MNRTIGVIAATSFEIAPSRHYLREKNIPVCISGIGILATAFHLLHFIEEVKPAFLIQAGIAGSFDDTLSLSEVVIAERDRLADLGVLENGQWKNFYDLQLAPANDDIHTDGWLVNHDWSVFNPGDLGGVRAITVNEVSTNNGKTNAIRDKYQPAIESLEGAAFHYVCRQKKVPFLQLRAISNYAGERDKNNWEIEKSILHLNMELESIIEYAANKIS